MQQWTSCITPVPYSGKFSAEKSFSLLKAVVYGRLAFISVDITVAQWSVFSPLEFRGASFPDHGSPYGY